MTGGGGIITVLVTIVGFMVRRLTTIHDTGVVSTRQLITNNRDLIQAAMSITDQMESKNEAAHSQLSSTVTELLVEAKKTNSRITKLELIEQLAKEQLDRDSHHQRGDQHHQS